MGIAIAVRPCLLQANVHIFYLLRVLGIDDRIKARGTAVIWISICNAKAVRYILFKNIVILVLVKAVKSYRPILRLFQRNSFYKFAICWYSVISIHSWCWIWCNRGLINICLDLVDTSRKLAVSKLVSKLITPFLRNVKSLDVRNCNISVFTHCRCTVYSLISCCKIDLFDIVVKLLVIIADLRISRKLCPLMFPIVSFVKSYLITAPLNIIWNTA